MSEKDESIGFDGRTYRQVWDECDEPWKKHFMEPTSIRYDYSFASTDGKSIFVELSCPHCSMTTGREHLHGCINTPQEDK